MKRSKKLLILMAVLVVVAVAYSIIALRNPLYINPETVIKETISEINSDTITQISWLYNGEEITLVRGDTEWSYADDSNFPLNQTKLTDLLSAASTVKSTHKVEDPEDPAEYGLDEPSRIISVLTSDGQETNYYIGTLNNITKEYYLMLNSEETVYMVPTDLIDAFSLGLFDLIQVESIPSITHVNSFSIQTEEGLKSFSLTEAEDGENTWHLDDGSGDNVVLDTEKTENLLSQITKLDFTNYADYYATDEELSSYGFEDSAAVTINYTTTTTDGSETDYTITLLIGGSFEDKRYAKYSDSTLIRYIAAETAEQILSVSAADLMPE